MLPIAAMAVGGVIGGLLSGKKPKVPAFRKVDATAEQGNAISGNLSNFDQAAELTGKTNEFTQEQLIESLRRAIPGYDDMVSKSSSVIEGQLRGELSQDVQDQISRRAAARGLAGGFSGSGMARNLELRDLGLTSLQQTQAGLTNSMNFLRNQAGIAVGPQMNVTSMFLSPSQRIAHEVGERNLEFQRNMTHAQIAAMPNPMLSGIVNGAMQGMGMAGGGGMGGGIASAFGPVMNMASSWFAGAPMGTSTSTSMFSGQASSYAPGKNPYLGMSGYK